MLTFLPPVVALFLLGWVEVPWYALVLLTIAYVRVQLHGNSWLARADHHAGADGKWLAGGRWGGGEIIRSWKRQPFALMVIGVCLAILLWRGQGLPARLDEEVSSSHQLVGSLETVGLKEMVEALKSPGESKKLEEKLGLSGDESLQQGSGGGRSPWMLQTWSRRRPFKEVE